MNRASIVAWISLTFSVACERGQSSELGEDDAHTSDTGDGDGDPGDGDGDPGDGDGDPGDGDGDLGDGDPGDGDGDPMVLEPCNWVPAPAAECDIPFAPIASEPPPLAMAQAGISGLDIIAREDAVEVMWVRFYADLFNIIEERRYLASNAQGPWQHEFLHAAQCDGGTCIAGSPRIRGSANRTQLKPPYLRREGGQWQIPTIDPQTDPVLFWLYREPDHFAVGPDDRSYFVESNSDQQNLGWWVWAETDLGCHVPTWRLLATDCRFSYVAATAVDAAASLHAIGVEQLSVDDWQLVHWFVSPDSVERTELAPLPKEAVGYPQEFAVGDSDEIHVCHNASGNGAVVIYGHGHDTNDWTSLEIEDPDFLDGVAQGYCKLALATDGTAWLAWQAGDYNLMDPLRVASVVDDVITYEIVDVGATEGSASLTVDPMGRPWLAYWPASANSNTFKIAHKDGDQWIIEQVFPP